MLFPLSKSLSSTFLFQSGGNHHERPARRVWSIDHVGAAERTAALHQLLAEKKPYTRHLEMCAARAEDGKRQDAERMREHKVHMREMEERVEEKADQSRAEMQAGIRDYNRRRSASESGLKQRLNEQHEEYAAWRSDMQHRVKDMPYIWGGSPPREPAERTLQRTQAVKDVAQSTRNFAMERKESKEQLANRTDQEWKPQRRAESTDAYRERKKAEGISNLGRAKRDYEAYLENLYDTHHRRIKANIRNTHQEGMAKEAHLASLKDSLTQTMGASQSRNSQMLKEMQDRVKTRPKSFGGYQAVPKSDKRHRNEKADAAASDGLGACGLTGGVGGNTSATLFGSTQASQKTLSPRTLGLASKSAGVV